MNSIVDICLAYLFLFGIGLATWFARGFYEEWRKRQYKDSDK